MRVPKQENGALKQWKNRNDASGMIIERNFSFIRENQTKFFTSSFQRKIKQKEDHEFHVIIPLFFLLFFRLADF